MNKNNLIHEYNMILLDGNSTKWMDYFRSRMNYKVKICSALKIFDSNQRLVKILFFILLYIKFSCFFVIIKRFSAQPKIIPITLMVTQNILSAIYLMCNSDIDLDIYLQDIYR